MRTAARNFIRFALVSTLLSRSLVLGSMPLVALASDAPPEAEKCQTLLEFSQTGHSSSPNISMIRDCGHDDSANRSHQQLDIELGLEPRKSVFVSQGDLRKLKEQLTALAAKWDQVAKKADSPALKCSKETFWRFKIGKGTGYQERSGCTDSGQRAHVARELDLLIRQLRDKK